MEIKIDVGNVKFAGNSNLIISQDLIQGKSILVVFCKDGFVKASEFAAEDKNSMQELAKAFENQAARIHKPCSLCRKSCKSKRG